MAAQFASSDKLLSIFSKGASSDVKVSSIMLILVTVFNQILRFPTPHTGITICLFVDLCLHHLFYPTPPQTRNKASVILISLLSKFGGPPPGIADGTYFLYIIRALSLTFDQTLFVATRTSDVISRDKITPVFMSEIEMVVPSLNHERVVTNGKFQIEGVVVQVGVVVSSTTLGGFDFCCTRGGNVQRR